MAVKKSAQKQKVLYRNLVAHNHPNDFISEQFKALRTNIKYSSFDKNMKTILVTSGEAGEGKSTIVANLAIVFAQEGKKVLLVDTDLRKPTVQYTFNLINANGLTSVLTNSVPVNNAIQTSLIPNLDILTSGPTPPNPSEMIGSIQMSKLISHLSSIYDLIIFDTPPITLVTDAQVLANSCDGSILVVRLNRVDRERVLRAKELLLSSRSCMLGIVVNGKKLNKKKNNYYY